MSAGGIIPAQWIVPQWPVAARVRAMTTTRAGGVSQGAYASFNIGESVGDAPESVVANRARLRALLPGEPVWLTQVHGTRIIDAASAGPDVNPDVNPGVNPGVNPDVNPEADGIITRARGVVLAIQSADCMPVLLADCEGTVIGAAHAGWRGLAGGVIENAVRAMDIPASRVLAWLGPAIGPASYEVGEDVYRVFVDEDAQAAQAFMPDTDGKYLVDLYALARQRLARMGVPFVFGGGYCTFRETGRFFSYRRDGRTGRMATLLWMEP